MLTFEELTEADVEEVSRIEEESFSMPWKPSDFMDMIRLDYAYYIVAKLDGKPIGCCGVRNMCGDGEITNVVISKDYRKRGYGERMFEYLLESSKPRGVVNFTLEVRCSNKAAISMYKKFGFVEEGIRPNFYEKPQEDGLIMWLRSSEE